MPKSVRQTRSTRSRSHDVELSGPASLVHRAASAGRRCIHCGGTRVTSITMTLTDGSPVDFLSCHTCERRSWLDAGSQLPFERVIEKTRKIA